MILLWMKIQDLLNTNPSYVVNIIYQSRTRPQCNGNMYINPTSYELSSFDINNPFNILYNSLSSSLLSLSKDLLVRRLFI